MKSARTLAAVLAMSVVLAGCKHRRAPVIPAAATAPPPPTRTIDEASAPLPAVPLPPAPAVAPPSDQGEKPAQKPHHSAHRRKTTSTPETPAKDQPAKDTTTQQAANSEAPASSPIGQITTAGDSGTMPSEQQIRETITNTENGLKGLNRSLSPSEKETVVQIRAFLQKARQALQQNDLEGAQTLATKARVLLGELTRS